MEEKATKKMKAGVMVHPKKPKEKIIAVCFVLLILFSVFPGVVFFNSPVLVLGMPLMVIHSILCIILTVAVLCVANYWKVW